MQGRFAILLTVVCLSSGIARSQSYQAFEQAEDGQASKVGWFLEHEFQFFLRNSCSLNNLLQSGNHTVSSIPVPLITALGGTDPQSKVWQWVYLPHTYTAADAFAMISTTKSLPGNPNTDYTLPLDALQDPETMLIAGTSSLMYSTNCTGIVAAAASVDSNIKFLPVSFSAAAKADYQNSTKAELGVIHGDFNSPFLRMYGGNDGDAPSMYAHMVLWNWYRLQYEKHQSLPTGPLYALHWFNGYTLYQINKLARQVDGSMNIDAKANYLGFVSGSTSLNGQYKDFGSTTVNDFKFAISAYQPEDTVLFDQLDSVDDIVTWSTRQPETGTFNALPKFSNVLRKGSSDTATHEQIIAGMPPSMCNAQLWTLNSTAATAYGTVALVPPLRKVDAASNQPPACAFTVSFVPSDNLLNGPAGQPIKLAYSFKTSFAGKSLEIPADAVSFTTSAFPQLAPISIGSAQVSVVNGTDLQWTINEKVQDDPSLPTPDSVQTVTKISGPTLSDCTKGSGLIDLPSGGLTLDSSGTQITITVQQDFSGGTMPELKPENLTSCKIEIRLFLAMKSGKTVQVDLPGNTRIAYPKLSTPHFLMKFSSK